MKIVVVSLLIIGSFSLKAQSVWDVDECMRYAVENSLEARKQELLSDDAKSNLTEATLAFLPSLHASSGVSASFGRSVDPETNSYINTSFLGNNIGVNSGVTIFDGLRNLNGFRVAKVSKLREEMVSQQVDNQIAIQTMSAYYKVVFAYGMLSIARDELKDSKKNHQKIEVQYEIGLSNIGDLTQLESQVSQGEYTVINLEGVYDKALVELKNQMYYPLSSDLDLDYLAGELVALLRAEEDAAAVFATAMEVLPDYKISQANVAVAKYNLSSSRARLFPSLSANGSISTGYNTALGGVSGNQPSYKTQFKDKMGQSIGVSISVPLFSGLSRQKNIQRSRNAYKRAQIDSQVKRREIEKMVIEALIDLQSYEKQCDRSLKNVEANTISYKTTQMKFDEGLSTVVDLQVVQTNLSKAKVEQINAYLNYLMQSRVVGFYKGEQLVTYK